MILFAFRYISRGRGAVSRNVGTHIMTYVVYILESETGQRFYIGHTNNLHIRLKQHNENNLGWTKRYRPWKLLYSEAFTTKPEAIQKEKYLKSLKNRNAILKYIAG